MGLRGGARWWGAANRAHQQEGAFGQLPLDRQPLQQAAAHLPPYRRGQRRSGPAGGPRVCHPPPPGSRAVQNPVRPRNGSHLTSAISDQTSAATDASSEAQHCHGLFGGATSTSTARPPQKVIQPTELVASVVTCCTWWE